MNGEPLVFSGRSNEKLAKSVARYLSIPLGNRFIKLFESNSNRGEIHVEYNCNLRKRDIVIIQTIFDPVNDDLMELLVMIDCAKRAKAKNITVIIPYMGYSRQDRKDKPRVPITSKLVAGLIGYAGADDALLINLHAPQIEGFFDIGVDHISCTKIMVEELLKTIGKCPTEDIVMVAPDEGAGKIAKEYRKFVPGSRLAVISKTRHSGTNTTSDFIMGEVDGKVCVLVDDLTSTGGTLINGAELLMKKGATKVYVAVAHGCFINNGKIKSYENIENSCIEKVLVTNSIDVKKSPKIKIVNLGKLIGECVLRANDGRSISDLFSSPEDDE